jgi:hypothetical protein
MSNIRLSLAIALPVLVCSCSTNHVATDLRGAVVRIEPDSVPFVRTPDIIKFTVNVIVRNDRSTPLYFGGCGTEAQQEINGKWETVWSPVCISPTGGSVAPRDSVTFPFTAAAFPNQTIDPHLDPRATAGRYRLRLGATYDGPSDYGVVYSVPTNPKRVTLGDLTSPVFIVYSP